MNLLTAVLSPATAQKKSVIIGNEINRQNAILILNPPDGNQGFLLPQLTSAQRLSIGPVSPADDGLVVFDITEKAFFFWKDNQWIKGLGGGGIETIAGDVTGDLNTTIVSGIQGNPVSPATLTAGDNGKVMVWNGSQWVAQTVAGASPSSQFYTIDPADFQRMRKGDKKDKDNVLIFEDDPSFVTIYKRDEGNYLIAPLHLPHGSTIEEITVYYVDDDGGNTSINVYRKGLTGTNQSVVNNWSSSSNASTISNINLTLVAGREIIDNSAYTYRIVAQLNPSSDTDDSSDASQRIYSIRIRYRL